MRQAAEDGPLHTVDAQARVPDHLLATLALGFSHDGAATRLTHRAHFGPLRVQKGLYPEGPDVCHAIVVHPPGGVVGGDELRIDLRAGAGAHALISTPGAAKWYRANGHRSVQKIVMEIDNHAALEWLPQETIFFNDADVALDTSIRLHGDARYLGGEILCFGRTASGERFTRGRIRQQLTILRDGRPLWLEQGTLRADGRAIRSPLGLAGHTVCATLVAVSVPPSAPLMTALRDACMRAAERRGQFGATQMKSATVVRYLGDCSETARAVMLAAWQQLRPALFARAATPLRIWAT